MMVQKQYTFSWNQLYIWIIIFSQASDMWYNAVRQGQVAAASSQQGDYDSKQSINALQCSMSLSDNGQ